MAGYKLKTHRGAAKRFDFTASGKVKRDMAFGSHLLTTKTAKKMRKLTTSAYADVTLVKMLKKLLPFK
ncbi:MAG TPA: 50S ribosomal protein L35 [Nitrospirota bacterium]|jgi:large subunit ribosomal protein L35